jgi:hypothetical protein
MAWRFTKIPPIVAAAVAAVAMASLLLVLSGYPIEKHWVFGAIGWSSAFG